MEQKHLRQLLTPSWVVNVVGLATGVLLTAGAAVLSRYQSSQLGMEIFENQSNTAATSRTGAYDAVSSNIANNYLLGSLPLLLTWAAIGLVVYFFAVSIYQLFGQAFSLRDQMGYVHSSRQALLRQALTNLVIRAGATLAWFCLIKLTIAVIIPYCLAAASVSVQRLDVSSVIYGLLSVIIIYADVYLFAVLLRLIVLRPRLLSR